MTALELINLVEDGDSLRITKFEHLHYLIFYSKKNHITKRARIDIEVLNTGVPEIVDQVIKEHLTELKTL